MTKKDTVVAAAGKIWVSRQYKKGAEENNQEQLEVQKFDTEPAYVKAGYGLTINLGNYESARCDVGVTLPCYTEELEEAFIRAWAIADEQVQKQVKEIKGK